MAKKRSAKLIMQQRKNFADAKTKLVGDVKGLASDENPEPMPANVASRFNTHLKSLLATDTPKEPRAKFGSWEGKMSTALGLAPSQNENRPQHFETGATEHLPDNVVSFADFMERKKNIKE
jgi:hypothetical protein